MEFNVLIYYLQTNIICLAILGYLKFLSSKRSSSSRTEDLIFSRLIYAMIPYCISDVCAWYFNGKPYAFAGAAVCISNIIYIASPIVMILFWVDYVFCKVENKRVFKGVKGILPVAPALIVILLILSTPLTGFAFTIDDANVYTRGIGAYLAPAASWVYILVVTIRTTVKGRRNSRSINKAGLFMVYEFLIPPLIGTVFQIAFYGLTTMGIAFTLSLLIVFVNRQQDQISLDELTGLNNKRELEKYLDKCGPYSANPTMCFCCIGIGNMSRIISKNGLLAGDNAVAHTASILKDICGGQSSESSWFLARNAGECFVIVGFNRSRVELENLITAIRVMVSRKNETLPDSSRITACIGSSFGKVESSAEVSELMRTATQDMKENIALLSMAIES